MPTVTFRDVSFSYSRKRTPALDHVSFVLGAGVTGLVGPNGAGKSTLLRILGDLLHPDAGAVLIDDVSPAGARAARRTGLIPETPCFDQHLTAGEFLTGLSHLLLLDSTALRSELEELWERPLHTLSLGQKRKVELTAALLADPDLILLDEPTNGLDPFAVLELRRTIESLNNGARTIIVSSHHLDELQRTADRLLLIANGACRGCWERDAATRDYGSVEGLFQTVFAQLVTGH